MCPLALISDEVINLPAVIGSSISGGVLIVLGILIIIWKKRHPHSRYCQSNLLESIEIKAPRKRYHAFVSYVSSRRDEVFVYHTLLPTLEQEGFRLCVHHRDFIPGEGNISLHDSWVKVTFT